MENTFIYTLSDPITKEVRYIGKTNNLKRRLSAHVSRARKTNSNSHKNNWVRKILNEGNKPLIEILEEVPTDNWEEYEIYWIEQFKNWGFRLLNTCEGGEGAKTGPRKPLPDKHKKLISKSLRKTAKERPEIYKNRERISIDKDELYQKYITDNLSIPKCADYFKCSWSKIQKSIKEYKIKKDKSIWVKQCANDYVMPTKPILQFDRDMNLIKKWEGGLKQIEDELNINRSLISRVCNGHRNHTKGFVWKYECEYIN